ncbi:MAG: hypothetical protein AB7U23_13260 [Dehalococcoidia bacterium]
MASSGRQYTGLYHDQILAEFRRAVREAFPDLTEVDDHDPFWQQARLLAFEGHRQSVGIDFVAAEMSIALAKRRPSMVSLGRRDGYALAADSPAVVDILATLTSAPGSSDVLVPPLARFRTNADEDTEAVTFEYLGASAITAGSMALLVAANHGATFAVGTGSLALPASFGGVGDAVYVGHASLMLSKATLTYNVAPGVYNAIVEVYDNHFRQRRVSTAVGSVVDNGGTLTIDVERLFANSAIGIQVLTGAIVRVTSMSTGARADLPVTWDGSKHVVTTSDYLGQSSPSTSGSDYMLSAEWLPPDAPVAVSHATVSTQTEFAANATQTYGEQTGSAIATRWSKCTVGGVEAFWARLRTTQIASSPTYPTSVSAAVHADNVWRLTCSATQGETVVDVLGTTTGQSFDSFRLNHEPYVEGSLSVLSVGGVTDWDMVSTTSSSDSNDQHFELLEDPSGFRSVVFGDGINGAIPASGQTVIATYRVGAHLNGNVGLNKVRNADAGVQFLSGVTNPRPATSWRQRDGADDAGIERLRRDIPGSTRTRERAVTAADAEFLAVHRFATADGRTPFARALAVELGAGPKSTLLVCVGTGGSVPDSADIAELETWFNGRRVGLQRVGGRVNGNQSITPIAYTPLAVTVALTVEVVDRYAKQARTPIDAAVRAAFHPLARSADGGWRWWAGADVTDAATKGIVGSAGVAGIIDVSVTLTPAAPISLAVSELPLLAGAPTINIIKV